VARTYVQRMRAESAATTRRRLIEAARSVLVEAEVPRLEIAEVATRAGVARSTFYLAFGTRSDFLSKLLDDSLARAGFGRLGEYLSLPDAVSAMKRGLAQAAAMYASDHEILRRMLLLARLDLEAAQMHAERQLRREASMRNLARRLHQQGKLRASISVEAAGSVLWILTSFETFDQLFSGWNLDARACGTRIVMIAHESLLTDSTPSSAPSSSRLRVRTDSLGIGRPSVEGQPPDPSET
jgi:AcrR family transcriptional regulator